MTLQQIAGRLVELCRQAAFEKAHQELYAQDAVSIEQDASPAFERETRGLDAMREKSARWNEMVEETHSITVSEPLLADHSFALTMTMDITMKGRGRNRFSELCVYRVKDGKITHEQFFM